MKVLIAGGGTGGHVNPGIAIANEIIRREPGSKILFAGTKRGIENHLVPKSGFELSLINVRGFRRKLSFDTFVTIKELLQGFYQARKVIKEFKPDIVIGTGGYVCGPVLLNASLMGIPTAIHESNVFPGITNKLLSRFVDAVMVGLEDTKKYIKAKKIYVTGTPIRPDILLTDRHEIRKKLGIADDEKVILAVGGSLGAEKINKAITNIIKKALPPEVLLYFGTGEKQYSAVLEELEGTHIDHHRIHVLPYIHNMHEIMPACDLIINRAGASTLSEITALGLPSILIPSPNVTHNHQEYNARALEKAGAAKVLLEKELDEMDLKKFIIDILNDDQELQKMSESSKKLGNPDSIAKIYDVLHELTQRAQN